MKKLLLLGGSRYAIPVIEAAHKLGMYVITCDYLPDNIAHQYSDEYHNISIIDKEAVLQLAVDLQIDGIMSFANDPGVVVAAYVAEKLALPTCPYESVKILQNKDLFRNFLKENGFNVPFAIGFESKDTALKRSCEFEFPVIVKPVDSAGSKGVSRVDNIVQLEGAIDYAIQHSFSGKFIIEAFIEKIGYSSGSDCFSINNELVCSSFSCQYFDDDAENPYTPAAESWPSNMNSDKIAELKRELQRLIKLLNLGTSIYNVEARVGKDGKTYIMEVSPRGGGNRLAEIIRYGSGEDMITNNVRASVGLPVENLQDPIFHGVWAGYVIHSSCEGKFSHLRIDSSFEKNYIVEKQIFVNKGDIVDAFTGANKSLGTLVLRFETQEELEEKLKNIKKYVEVILL